MNGGILVNVFIHGSQADVNWLNKTIVLWLEMNQNSCPCECFFSLNNTNPECFTQRTWPITSSWIEILYDVFCKNKTSQWRYRLFLAEVFHLGTMLTSFKSGNDIENDIMANIRSILESNDLNILQNDADCKSTLRQMSQKLLDNKYKECFWEFVLDANFLGYNVISLEFEKTTERSGCQQGPFTKYILRQNFHKSHIKNKGSIVLCITSSNIRIIMHNASLEYEFSKSTLRSKHSLNVK